MLQPFFYNLSVLQLTYTLLVSISPYCASVTYCTSHMQSLIRYSQIGTFCYYPYYALYCTYYKRSLLHYNYTLYLLLNVQFILKITHICLFSTFPYCTEDKFVLIIRLSEKCIECFTEGKIGKPKERLFI
uniref:Uncharacterized protein n=1 Tax=Panstrongylus lignarius TaxID=156445 RepID=A0A224XWJ4_9HEMI